MGVGKTTAIAAVCDRPPLLTEVGNSDRDAHGKATTTVAMDYGEVTIDGGDRLRLYGLPGQDRFDFVWRTITRGALGVVVLIDNSRPDPRADLHRYLAAFGEAIAATSGVIGITRTLTHPQPDVDAYVTLLASLGMSVPVFTVDPRERSDVLMLLDVLFHQIEANMAFGGDARAVRP